MSPSVLGRECYGIAPTAGATALSICPDLDARDAHRDRRDTRLAALERNGVEARQWTRRMCAGVPEPSSATYTGFGPGPDSVSARTPNARTNRGPERWAARPDGI